MNERPGPLATRTPWRVAGLAWVTLIAAGSLALAPSCLDRRRDVPGEANATRCATCHGDPSRAGDYLLRSAPPRDLLGASGTGYPGVGAHAIHLRESATHAGIACSECHTVPERADSPGHADDDRPAELVFGPLASSGGRKPHYDSVARTCADGYCHREQSDAVWTEPRSSSAACGSCHGLPPPVPHPQSERCEACHGDVVDAGFNFIDATLHVDGNVQTMLESSSCASCHGAPPPAPHPQLSDCSSCHAEVVGPDDTTIVNRERHVNGSVDLDFESNCTSCHGGDNAAPPMDLEGNSATTFAGVGAHQAHLGAGARSRAVPCAECHVVPEGPFAPGHIDSALPAEVQFSGAAIAFGATPMYEGGSCSQTACHGGKFPGTHRSGGTNTAPQWTKVDGTEATCGSCHGLPPPPPHPYPTDCSQCHENVAKGNASFVRPELHVDGIVTFTVP